MSIVSVEDIHSTFRYLPPVAKVEDLARIYNPAVGDSIHVLESGSQYVFLGIGLDLIRKPFYITAEGFCRKVSNILEISPSSHEAKLARLDLFVKYALPIVEREEKSLVRFELGSFRDGKRFLDFLTEQRRSAEFPYTIVGVWDILNLFPSREVSKQEMLEVIAQDNTRLEDTLRDLVSTDPLGWAEISLPSS